MLIHAEMVMKLSKPGNDVLQALTGEKVHIWHMTSCLMGEAGELLVATEMDDHQNLIEELGDLEFYVAGLRQQFNIDYALVATMAETVDFEKDVYAVDGVMIASCDIFDACKKWVIYEQDLNTDKLMNALARFERHLSHVRTNAGITRQETIDGNMAKLAKRYGADYNYSNAAAKARADKVKA